MKRKKRPKQQAMPSETAGRAVRRIFYRQLLYIVLGLVVMVLFWEQPRPVSHIAFAAFLFSSFYLVQVVKKSQAIIDDFFPLKQPKQISIKPFEKFMYYFSTVFFLGAVIFLLFEVRWLALTMDGRDLFWTSAFIGICMAIIFTLIIRCVSPSVYHESNRRYTVHFGLFVGCFLFVPASASLINRHYADQAIDCQTYVVGRKDTGTQRNRSYGLFLKLNGNAEKRFDVGRKVYEQAVAGGQIQVCKKRGKLGYHFVHEFKALSAGGVR